MKNKSHSIMSKIMISYSLLVFIILSFIMSDILYKNIRLINHYLEEKISLMAYMLSEDENIIHAVEKDYFSPENKKQLKQLLLKANYIDYIVVANDKGVRLYHPEDNRIGENFLGGDEKAILSGSDAYISEIKGNDISQKRAFHGIYNKQGKVIGFIMVSTTSSTINYLKKQTLLDCLIVFIFAVLLAIIFSFFIAKGIRKALLGYDPSLFTEMYLQREEVLETLDEGVLAIDEKKQCIYINKAAKKMLCLDHVLNNKVLINDFINKHLSSTLITNQKETNLEIQIQNATVLITKIPIKDNERNFGAIAILRDKTEVIKLAEQLTGVNYIVEALRANTHEYINKLHIILGLLQLGEIQMAKDYITQEKTNTGEGYSMIIKKIENRTIAALLLGKQSKAKELNIELILQKDSYLEAYNDFLSTNDLVTILGNLIENAFDATKHKDDIRQIQVFIKSNTKGLTIIVDDTGIGMTNQDLSQLNKGIFSTKGEGRGIGLSLIKNIVNKSDGYLEIESEVDTGSCFTISINKKRFM